MSIFSTKVINYNVTIQVVFQGTNILHIHVYDFYVVGEYFGNHNYELDPIFQSDQSYIIKPKRKVYSKLTIANLKN